MGESRLRIKMGETEFETEGPPDFVHAQFEAFQRLIAPPPPMTAPVSSPPPAPPIEPIQPQPLALGTILQIDGEIVSLRVNAKPEDAVLAILLGQKELRNNEVVSGG